MDAALRVYPNPTAGTLRFVNLAFAQSYVCRIYTISGQKAFSIVVRGSEAVHLDDLLNGQYIVVLRDETGREVLRSGLLIVR